MNKCKNFFAKGMNFISKGLAFIYVFLISIFKNRGKVMNNKVLIIASGHIGNAIMDIEAINEIKNIFVKDGKEIYLLCSPMLWKTFRLIEDMSEYHFIGENYIYNSSNGTEFKNVYTLISALKRYEFEKIIVTLTIDPRAHYVVAGIKCNESYGVFDDVKRIHGSFRYYFERFYTNKITAPIDLHEFQRLKMLVQAVGGIDYKVKIHYILPNAVKEKETPIEIRKNSKYITIAMDSASTERRWTKEQFYHLVSYLLQNYNYDIYCTGNVIANEVYEYCVKKIGESKRLINYAGKTDMQEWFELLRNAEFHIGVDSGSIHAAASVGTQAFCMTGVWDGKRCLPYQIDQEDEKTTVPICIYRSDVDVNTMHCYGCKVFGARIGRGNDECYRESQNKKPCLCLQQQTYRDVIEKIDQYLASKALR